MKIRIFLLCSLFGSSLRASPARLEIIFLSSSKSAFLERILPGPIEWQGQMLAEAENCIPMGDGCFHPQLGFVEKMPLKLLPPEKVKNIEIKTFNSLDTSLVDCKEGNYFDIFCGKETVSSGGTANIEVWIDTSSSMKRMDYSKEKDYCGRKRFAVELKKNCQENIRFYSFDTSRKEVMGLSSLCLNHGLNDQDRMIQWIKDSEVKHLVILTDIDELSEKFREFLQEKGAEIYGADFGEVSASNLTNYAEKIAKNCSQTPPL